MDDALRKAGLFQGVDINDVEAISNEFEIVEVSRGQILFHEGEPGDSLYIVLSGKVKLGRTSMLGAVPLDPVLQWREQLISDNDTYASQIANQQTVDAFETLAMRLVDDAAWRGL